MNAPLYAPMGIPAYTPELFVDREREQSFVRSLVQRICAGDIPSVRTITFYGALGLGKSWLALHLKRTVLPKLEGVTVLLLSFASQQNNLASQAGELFIGVGQTANVDATVDQIVSWVIQALSDGSSAARQDDPAATLIGAAHARSQSGALVLVFDHIYDADRPLLATLEQRLLAPLASVSRVLLVLLGRRVDYSWKSSMLRVSDRHNQLNVFFRPQIQEQLYRLREHALIDRDTDPGTAEQVERLSSGIPLYNVLVARQPRSGHGAQIVLLRQRLENQLPAVAPRERDLIHLYLETLCVLDGFRDEYLLPLLELQRTTPSGHLLAELRPSELRERLSSYRLVRWDATKKLSRIDEPVRRAVEAYLRAAQPALWCRLHQCAYRMYLEFASALQPADYYWKCAEYHREILGGDPEALDCGQHQQSPF